MTIPYPENEQERLAALHRLGILDTEPDGAFNRISKLAQDVFGVSIAAVTLIDEDRQWFKSACGWDVEETDRETSFCTHAIMSDGVMVVEDATKDERFASNPLVTGKKGIRFYAGAPLIVEGGMRVGSLCVLDDESRTFGFKERDMLLAMSDVVVDLLEAHKQAHEIGYLSSALEAAKDSVLITEAEPLHPPGPRIVWANQAFFRMTGYESEEILGETPRIFQGPETDRVVLNKVRSALENERAVSAETVNYRKDGTPYVVNWHLAPVHDERGELTHWISVQRDTTDEKRRREHLEHEAKHDSLTGLPNRYAVQKEIQEIVSATGTDQLGTLLYLDLDDFKPINDKFGHTVGDEVLVRTSEILRQVVREEDLIGRLGGDEFIILLSDVDDPVLARTVAERVHEKLRTSFTIDGQEVAVAVSIGGTLRVAECESVEEALHVADTAMYEAKGKEDCTIVLSDSSTERRAQRSALELEKFAKSLEHLRKPPNRPA